MSTNEDAAIGGSDFIGHDASGKHLLLKVPDYEDSVASGGGSLFQASKDTYLNLGRGMGDPARNLPEWYAPTAQGATRQWDASGLAEGAVTTAATSGDDLLAFFGGFVDDKRLRGGGGTFEQPTATPPSEAVARVVGQAPFSAVDATAAPTAGGRNLQVTATIPDYLGWRDHTDGHRITTTRGDKIEIIGGNYKLVSLGRGQGVATYEMSGGIILDGDEPAGQISSVTWRPCPTNPGQSGWKVVEQVVQGNNVNRYHGTVRDEVYGDKIISVTGAPTELTSGIGLGKTGAGGTILSAPSETATDAVKEAFASAASRDGTEEGLCTEDATATEPNRPASLALPTKWDEEGGTPPKLQQPEIYESTWAKSITAYTKVAGASNDHVHVSGKLTEKLRVEGDHEVVGEYSGTSSYSGTTKLRGSGQKFIEKWEMEGSMGFYEYFQGAMTQFFFGASTTMGLANRFEIFVGFEEQVNFGGFFEIKGPVQLGISVGSNTELDFLKHSFKLDETEVALAELKTSISDTNAHLSFFKTALQDSATVLTAKTNAAINML